MPPSHPCISVITVVYNNAATIREAVESVLNQDYPHIQYIVVDGGSTDGTREILSEYQMRIHTLISEPDKGIYDAMNKGLTRCTGEWVAILNSDDFYAHTGVLSAVVACFQSAKCDAVYGNLVYVDPADTQKVVRYWKSGPYNRAAFRMGWMPPHPAFFLKRQAYLDFGYFREDMRMAADYELMLRMLYKNGLSAAWLPQTLVHMRLGGISNQSLGGRWKANQEDRYAWKINGLHPNWLTLWLKPLRKLGQFLPFARPQ